jgi:hypothetical protein
MTIDVTIESIGEINTYGANGFRKREMVALTQEGEYAQPLIFEFVQDKCELLDSFLPGEDVSIDFNLKGNRWQPEGKPERIFISIQGWRIEKKPLSAADQYDQK